MRPVLYPHPVACEHDLFSAAALWTLAGLLDSGLSVVIASPFEERHEFMHEVLHDHGIAVLRDRSKASANDASRFLGRQAPVLLTTEPPLDATVLLFPWLAVEFEAHRALLARTGQAKRPVRLHFLLPPGPLEPALKALMPDFVDGAQCGGFTLRHGDALVHNLHFGFARWQEHHPEIVSVLGGKLTAKDIEHAMACLSLPSPSSFQVNSQRLRNLPGKKKGEK